jgi:hypothetical protein
MTAKEINKLKIESKPLDETEQKTLRAALKGLKDYSPFTLPLEIVLMLVRNTYAKGLNARRKRIKGKVAIYADMMSNSKWHCTRMWPIFIFLDELTVPDGMTRLLACLLHGSPVKMTYSAVTEEENRILMEADGLVVPRSVADRLQPRMTREGYIVEQNMNNWTPSLKYLHCADRQKYISSQARTVDEYLETFIKHEKAVRWVMTNFKRQKDLNRCQIQAAFVYMYEKEPEKAGLFMTAWNSGNMNVEVHVDQASALLSWVKDNDNIRPKDKEGKSLRGWGALEERVFFACSYCIMKYLNGQPVLVTQPGLVAHIKTARNYFLYPPTPEEEEEDSKPKRKAKAEKE